MQKLTVIFKDFLEKIKTCSKNEELKAKLKSVATFFAAGLMIAIFSAVIASLLYHPKKMIKRGFEVAVSKDGKPIEKVEEKPVDLATLLKTADFDRGAKVAKKCASCHSFGKGEAAKVGPNLYGIIGRAKAATAFNYSDAMRAKGGSWDKESINNFITKPKDFVPGTKMAFAGLKKPQDRADVILYLERQK
ncbi:MAG: cytochrome c family protein [Pelagibacterales bacterium]|nr:cytochrome c family protein [Pelagibacterales bacterium]